MEPLKIVQLGAGGWGAGWPEFIQTSPDWELVGLWNRGEERLESTREKYGLDAVICTTDLSEALGKSADAVLISTPHPTHAQLGFEAIKAGKHVLVEKPLAHTWEDAKALVDAADHAGKTLCVGQNFRFREPVWRIRELLRQGAYGPPDAVFGSLQQAPYIVPEWRRQQPYPMLSEVGIHHFDVVRFTTGLEPISVTCNAWNPRGCEYESPAACVSQFEFEGGMKFLHCGNWGARGAFTTWDGEWRYQLEKGAVSWDGNEARLFQGNDTKDDLPEVGDFPGFDRHGVLADLAVALREDRPPLVNGNDNLKSLAMAFAAIRAAEEDRPVALNEFLGD